MQRKNIFFLLAAASIIIGLEACDDSDDRDTKAPKIFNRPGISTQQGDIVQARESITINFIEAIDVRSITLSGSLADEVDTAALALQEGEKIDIFPSEFWSAGANQTLTVIVDDFSGNQSKPFTVNVKIPMTLDNGQAASVVLGQVDFNSNIESTAPDQRNYASPQGSASFFNNSLYTPDTGQNRILSFAGIPGGFPVDASSQIGQKDLNSSDGDYVNAPVAVIKSSVTGIKEQYFIVDRDNNRVLVFDQLPTAIDSPAKFIIGDTDAGCSQTSLNKPSSVTVAGDMLAVTDSGNHRVLLWNLPIARQSGPAIDLLGQTNFDSCLVNAGTAAIEETDDSPAAPAVPGVTGPQSLNNPTAVISDGTNFLVVDSGNNRAIGWIYLPGSTDSPFPNYVLGQEDFTGSGINNGGTSNPAKSLNQPLMGASYNGAQLCISDTANHRVLIWNSMPNADKTAADVVIGQASMVTSELAPAVTAQTLSSPTGCLMTETQLMVTDTDNHRVLIYDALQPNL